ncbi:MAG: cytochrome b/b6 domain-containing protein [Erythrobacter sp.]
MRSITVWDWPVRLSHWSFAVLVPAMWYTAEYSHWYWHTRLGTVLLGVLTFRLIWGVIGSQTARFSQFVKGPRAVLNYLRGSDGEAEPSFGHSPIGALSVIALLTAMLIQLGMGLFAGDPYDGATGPLNSFVGVMTADQLTDWHEDFVCVVLALAALHLAAIAFYAIVKRRNLVGPMLTGAKNAEGKAAGLAPIAQGRAIAALLVAAGIALWVWFGAPPFG